MKKEKRCKGTGKALGHGCLTMQPYTYGNSLNHTYGLARTCKCFQKWAVSTPEGQELISKTTLRAKKQVAKEERKKTRAEKEALKDWKKDLQIKVQHIARLIDNHQPCLTLTPEQVKKIRKKPKMDGGHIYTKGGNSQMRFNLHNIHRQSSRSNRLQADDPLMREGIIREYGQEYMDFISSLRSFEVPKLSQLEYKEAYYRCLIIINALKKEDKVFGQYDRIMMRNRFNYEIGIYTWEQTQFSI